MKNSKEKVKQITLSFIALMLILLGYANYSLNNKEDTVEVASRTSSNEASIGDVELVNSNPVDGNYIEGIVSNDELENTQNTISNSTVNNLVEDTTNYFEETRIQRDRMYSETLETYQKLIDSSQTPQEQNNGNISVIVKSSNLSQDEISKIQNIVQRELSVDISNINISNK